MKTDLTRQAEKCLWHYTNKMGIFGCFEVTIDWFGKEKVDFMICSTGSTIRCYEIRITVADLESFAKQTFLDGYSYLVITNELWEKIQANPKLAWKYYNQEILVFSELSHNLGITSAKKTKKKNVTLGARATVLESMMRSLSREVEKSYKVRPFWGLSEEAKQMKIIARDRGTGKTTELVKKSARTGQYILASNRSHVRAIGQIAEKAGVTIPYPVTVDEIVSMDRFTCTNSIQRDGLLVDEAIMVLSRLIGLKIAGATISLTGEQQCQVIQSYIYWAVK